MSFVNRLTEILKTVDLSYLMEREGVMTEETNWCGGFTALHLGHSNPTN